MFSSSRRTILKKALRFKYNDSLKSRWWLIDNNLIPIAQSIASAVDKFNGSFLPDNIEIIKNEDRRFILRIDSSQSVEKSFIAKVFPLCCLRHRLKYHRMKYKRFAFGEAVNLLIAAERGLNVPMVYGYGRIYGSSFLIKTDVLLLEDLADQTAVDKLLELNSNDQKKCAKILERTIPIIIGLYKAGCNNIGFNTGAIMLGDGNSAKNDFILDFEYAEFHDKPSLEVLMFEAANFAKYCRRWLTEQTINEWRAKLLDAIEIGDDVKRGNLIERFNYYFNSRLSRKERLKIY